MTERYTPPHLFTEQGKMPGHSILEFPKWKLSAEPEQLNNLRALIAQRMETWRDATEEQRATLPPVLTYASDGGGVQSTAIKRLVEDNKYPAPDVYIFSDTQYEGADVYDGLRSLHGNANGPVFLSCTTGDIYEDQAVKRAAGGVAGKRGRFAALPFFTYGSENARRGMVKRQCTSEYKIEVVLRVVRYLCGLEPRQRWPKWGRPYVEQWLGISTDEIQRAKMSVEHWLRIEHPLLDLRMSRGNCLAWLRQRGYAEPARSACIGCPLRSDSEWIEMKRDRPEEWESAVQFDAAIRRAEGMKRLSYLHASGKPLAEVELGEDQGDLFSSCDSGWCGT